MMTNKEKTPKAPKLEVALRERLREEVDSHRSFEFVSSDSREYMRASLGLKALTLQALRSADTLEKEIERQEALEEGDPKKMSPEELQKYRDYLTEVHSWGIILPHLLTQARIVQFHPEVQARLKNLADNLYDHLRLGEELEEARQRFLVGSRLSPEMMMRFSIRELSFIATYDWIRREKPPPREDLMRDAARLEEHLETLGYIREAEKEHRRKTERTEEETEKTRKRVDEERAIAGAERVTMGYPGAEYILHRPELSMFVWLRLLSEGGPREKKSAAEQLSGSVGQFVDDFIKQGAFERFRDRVKDDMEKFIAGNKAELKRSKAALGLFLGVFGEFVSERLTTDPEEFERVFNEIMSKVGGEFERVVSLDHGACRELLYVLEKMKAGEEVDRETLQKVTSGYARLLREAGLIMSATQNWQMLSNALRPGGRGKQTRLEHMLDQATKYDGKSTHEMLRRFAPYGAFQTRGYWTDEHRFILLKPPAAPSEYGVVGHIVEIGKLGLETAAASVVLSHLLARLPVIARITSVAVPVVLAEGLLAVSKAAALSEVQKIHVQNINECLRRLKNLQQRKDAEGRDISNPEVTLHATGVAVQLQTSIMVLLQAANASFNPLRSAREDAQPDPKFYYEAHVYANQLMNAFGFPGYHRMPPEMTLSEPPEGTSPEVQNYIRVRNGDRRMHYREQLGKLSEYIENVQTPVEEPAAGKKPPERPSRKDKYSQLYDGEYYPSGMALGDIVSFLDDAANTEEMDRYYNEYEHTHERQEVLEFAGKVFRLNYIIETTRNKKAPRKSRDIFFSGDRYVFQYIPGPHIYIADTGDLRHLIPRETLDEWNVKAKELARVPMQQVLAIARYLEEHQPTNQEIQGWFTERLSKRGIARNFGGPEGNRGSIGAVFLKHWAIVRAYADKYSPPEREYKSNEAFKQRPDGDYVLQHRGNILVYRKSPDGRQMFKVEGEFRGWENPRWRFGSYSSIDVDLEETKFDKEDKEFLLHAITTPIDGNDELSISRIFDLFSGDTRAQDSLRSRLLIMYRESWDQRSFLKELIDSIKKHGAKISEENWEEIYYKMRKSQEYGMFGYGPEKVSR